MNDIFAMLAELKPEMNFHGSDDFVMDGLLDSFDIISLTSMIEEKYSITVDGLDIVPENFCSIDAIADLIRKSGGKL